MFCSFLLRRSITSRPKVTPVWPNAGFVGRWEHLPGALIQKEIRAETKPRRENRALKPRGSGDPERPAGCVSFERLPCLVLEAILLGNA